MGRLEEPPGGRRTFLENKRGRINVAPSCDIDLIDDEMGLYVALYEPTAGSRYVAYVGYSKKLSTELKIRFGLWESEGRLHPRRGCFPFAAFYLPSLRIPANVSISIGAS